MSSELALTIAASLIVTTATALFSKKMSVSLIMLFYSSITLGVIFTLYGSVLVGLLHIVTFAGAIPVILLTVIMMTGESNLEIGANRLTIILLTLTLLTVAIASYSLFSYLPIKQSSSLF